MFLMLAEAMRLWTLHDAFPASRFWAMVAYNTEHVPWQGCSLHDLIQPAFSFLVGAALPFSIASRLARGQTFRPMLGHAVWRSAALIVLGILLRSLDRSRTYWTFEDTLTQIGLGYTVPVPAGVRVAAGAGDRLRHDPGRLLGGVRAVSRCPRPASTTPIRCAGELAASLFRLPRALQQELEPRVGVRRLVPEPVPAREAIPLQRRRMVHPELHPDAGDDDLGLWCGDG